MKRPVVGVIDYGAGNLRSVQYALKNCGAEVLVVDRLGVLSQVSHLVLPGVGSMSTAMAFLRASMLDQEVREFASNGDRPILGICLGMQMMATTGIEGGVVDGLNLIRGVVKPLPKTVVETWKKTPRIGWMSVSPNSNHWKSTEQMPEIADRQLKYYFAHGFHIVPEDPSVIAAVVTGDPVSVVAAIQLGHLYGTQFHPEKSGDLGLELLRSFLEGANWQGDDLRPK